MHLAACAALAVCIAAGTLGFGCSASAQVVCGGTQRVTTRISLPAAFNGSLPDVSHVWGRANVAPTADGLRVAFAQGSVDPGNTAAPTGGAGFEQRAVAYAEARCLHYEVRFAPGFDFAKGGKLPGLFGGEAPRGCLPKELSLGFSARLMWRAQGAGELYLYAPGRSARCGDSIGRGAWRFVPGSWTSIDQEVAVNALGQANGRIRIWVDGRKVIERTDLILRDEASIGVDGLLFATFFGGNDPSWASPKAQSAEFRNFEIGNGPGSP